MEQQNILEKIFLGKKYKKTLIVFYSSLLLVFFFYFLGEICGKALFYFTH